MVAGAEKGILRVMLMLVLELGWWVSGWSTVVLCCLGERKKFIYMCFRYTHGSLQ